MFMRAIVTLLINATYLLTYLLINAILLELGAVGEINMGDKAVSKPVWSYWVVHVVVNLGYGPTF